MITQSPLSEFLERIVRKNCDRVRMLPIERILVQIYIFKNQGRLENIFSLRLTEALGSFQQFITLIKP